MTGLLFPPLNKRTEPPVRMSHKRHVQSSDPGRERELKGTNEKYYIVIIDNLTIQTTYQQKTNRKYN